jgi:hypothetical protein
MDNTDTTESTATGNTADSLQTECHLDCLLLVRARAAVAPIVMAGVVWMMAPGIVGAVPAEGQAARTTAIRAISTAASGPALVTIEATGALPLPTSGVVDGPPRIYFDFPGVALNAPRLTASTDPRIRRIRAGVHSATPLVTRVVLDLVTLQPFRLERVGAGRITVIVGGSPSQPSPGIAPVPPLPERPPASPVARELVREPMVAVPAVPREPAPSVTPPPASVALTPPPARPVTPVPAPPPERLPEKPPPRASPSASGPPLPARDLERYRRQVSPALDRLRLQQPLLTSLDGAEDQTVDRLQLAVEEFERLRQELAGIKPPETLRSQHDMLFQSTTLALMATRLRLEAFRTSDPTTLRNAASAAAGATLLLDRACADLGCPDSGR